MPTPTNRTPVRVARGTYSNLNTNKADIQEGEICYATDQDKLYVKEGGTLVSTQADLTSTAKTDVAQTFSLLQTLSSGLNVSGTTDISGSLSIDGSYTQAVDVITPSTSPAIDCSLGNYFTLDLSSTNVSGTWTFTNVPTTKSFGLVIEITTGASTTIVWNSAQVNGGSAGNIIKWNNGTAPTLAASKPHLLILSTYDTGASWYGAVLKDFAVV